MSNKHFTAGLSDIFRIAFNSKPIRVMRNARIILKNILFNKLTSLPYSVLTEWNFIFK